MIWRPIVSSIASEPGRSEVQKPFGSFRFSERAERTQDQPIGVLISKALANPGMVSLAAGLVDYETLPVQECRELLADLLTDNAVGRARLNYGTTLGLPALRQALHRHMAALDGVQPEA